MSLGNGFGGECDGECDECDEKTIVFGEVKEGKAEKLCEECLKKRRGEEDE